MALFSTNLPQQSNHLVEFRAGKMFMRGNMVHPDNRKGLIYVYQSDDGLMHFCWKDRTSGTVEDDLIIFPDDVEFIPVKQCTTGRVYLLRFKNSQKKMFFWMQAFKSDKDEENCKKVNEYLNNPPVPGAGRMPGGRIGGGGHENLNDQFAAVSQLLNLDGSGGGSGEDRVDIQNVLSGMDQQQLMQLLNLVGGSSGSLPGLGLDPSAFAHASATQRLPVPVTTSVSSTISSGVPITSTAGAGTGSAASGGVSASKPQNIIQPSDLRNILANMGVAGGGGDRQENQVDLNNILTAKNVKPVINPEHVERLLPHLPSEAPVVPDSTELMDTLHSSLFKQAIGSFGAALQSGQLGPCMRQFGFPANVINAVEDGDIQSVAEVLEDEAKKKKEKEQSESGDQKKSDDKGSESEKKDKKDDDAMDLD